ncbi:origin recognition complex subunit 4 C-terminus-domain-containing protein [Astrocystis sublimbata]|nr:origin recognition complex subunit 4 C-terminus-domain-containing protein [Astrocystis sublimbata]
MAPSQTPGAGRRKRSRPDDSSPAPSPSSVAATAKRRRLNGVADSPSSTPKAFSAITLAIGGLRSRLARGIRGATTATDTESSYDVPDSDGEEPEAPASKPKKLDFGRHANTPRLKPKPKPKPGKPPATETTNLYDVPDSGDEHDPVGMDTGARATDEAAEGGPKTASKQRSAKDAAKAAPARSTAGQKGDGQTTKPIASHTNMAGMDVPRKRGRPPKSSLPPAVMTYDEFPLAVKQRIYKPASKGVAPSSSSESPKKLKGILSPQKRKAGRPTKTVVFSESEEIDSDMPDPDTDATPRPKPKSTGKSLFQSAKDLSLVLDKDLARGSTDLIGTDTEKEDTGNNAELEDGGGGGAEEEEEEDDEVCAICSKPDSEPPNEIIFCEVCDRGFHQKCYDVPVVPEGDWICRTCSQEDALPEEPAVVRKKASVSVAAREIPGIPNFEQHLQKTRRVLLDRCSGKRRIKLRGQTDAYEKTYQLVEQTVLAGEGNSMMVIGGRGSGKTTMVEEILCDLRAEHAEAFHVVRLNGFIHTDDKLALKEIWRQLGREMEIEDDLINKTNNYADTMASLLALLSHPEEITGGAEDGVTSKSVVFIIDEFELFATHARQTLLYNLFDIAQARKAPIAVLGLTTRIDVVESLEKRVKSRFSHRYVYLSLPKSLPAYWDVCKQGLIVDKEDLEVEGFDPYLEGLHKFHDYWNKNIETLRQTPAFEDFLEYQYYTTKSVSAFLTSCIQPLSGLSMSSLDLVMPSPVGAITLEPQEPKLQLLVALSDLELSLLIAAARLDIVAHTDTVNFAMAYDEYSGQMGKQRAQTASSGLLALGAGARVWSRSVAVVAWERLVSLGLLIPAGIGGRSNAAHGGLEGKMWRLDVALEEIPSAVELPGFLVKWCSQI